MAGFVSAGIYRETGYPANHPLAIARIAPVEALVVTMGADALKGDALSGLMLSNQALFWLTTLADPPDPGPIRAALAALPANRGGVNGSRPQ